MENKYPIASSTWDDAEINAIKKVIDTGAYSMGKFVFEFETKFSEYFNSKYYYVIRLQICLFLVKILMKNP